MVLFPIPIFLFYLKYIPDDFLMKVKAILNLEPKSPTKTDLVLRPEKRTA